MNIYLFYFFVCLSLILCSEIETELKDEEEVSTEELQSLLKKLKEELGEIDSPEQQKQKIYENVTMVNIEDLILQKQVIFQIVSIDVVFRNKMDKNQSLQFLEKLHETLSNEIVFGLVKIILSLKYYKVFDEPDSRIFSKYNIQTNQKLVFFNKMKKIVYEGNISDLNEISSWINDQMYHSLMIIETQEDYDLFISKTKMTRILALYNSSMIEERLFLDNLVTLGVFADTGNYIVGYSENQELVSNIDSLVIPSIILFKDFDTSKPYETYIGNFTDIDDILEFCHLASIPLVTYYSEETAYRIFAGPMKVTISSFNLKIKTQIILFINETENNKQIIKQFEAAAKYNLNEELYYERMIYTIITSNPENQEMLEFFGMEYLKYPEIFISTISKEQLAKFKFNQDAITEENIIEFARQFRLKSLPRLYLTEQIPKPSNKTIQKLVGQNFEQEVYRNHQNYLILFCSEIEKEQCTSHIKLFKEIFKMMNDKDKELMGIGMLNPIKNELPRFMQQPYLGEILLYLKGKKTMPDEYTGEIEFSKIKQFIQEKIPEITFQDKPEVLSLGAPVKSEL